MLASTQGSCRRLAPYDDGSIFESPVKPEWKAGGYLLARRETPFEYPLGKSTVWHIGRSLWEPKGMVMLRGLDKFYGPDSEFRHECRPEKQDDFWKNELGRLHEIGIIRGIMNRDATTHLERLLTCSFLRTYGALAWYDCL